MKDLDVDKGPLGRAHHRGAYGLSDQAGVEQALAGSATVAAMLASIQGFQQQHVHPDDYHLSHSLESPVEVISVMGGLGIDEL